MASEVNQITELLNSKIEVANKVLDRQNLDRETRQYIETQIEVYNNLLEDINGLFTD